jgi:hypothetical protein
MEWDEGDLVDRLCRAIDISRKSLALFSERGYSETESVENNFRPDKPIAEASMLLYAASAVSHHRKVADRVEDVARLIAPLARSKRIMLSMSLCPSLSVEFAVPHVLLSKLGYTDPQFDEFLALCLSSQASRGHERPPFASLERRWILELWSGVDAGDDWQIDAAQSVLNWPIDLIGGLKEDAYALTHLVVYSTDFGNRLKPLPRDSSIILAEARSFLARCLDEEDYDLAAEMLMIWPELCAPWCASSSFAFRVLITIEDQVGVLPSVRTKSDRLASLMWPPPSPPTRGSSVIWSRIMSRSPGPKSSLSPRWRSTTPDSRSSMSWHLSAPRPDGSRMLSDIARLVRWRRGVAAVRCRWASRPY